MTQQVIWSPQPGPQTDLLRCPVSEVMYGGARGGGKSEGCIGDWLAHSDEFGDRASGIFIRRTSKQLEDMVTRTKRIYPLIGAKFREQRLEWEMPSGALLKFRYLERDSDADNYLSHEYTRIYVEQAETFPSPVPIDMLRGTLRSSKGVRVGMRLTSNPGGPGHQWVKARYITPHKPGYRILTESFKNPFTNEWQTMERVFIPSRLSDNPLLMQADPLYAARLQQQGSQQLVKAWLLGDWDQVQGAFFDRFNEDKHVLPYDAWIDRIPPDAVRIRAFDWGSAKPFCVLWAAVSDGRWGLPYGALLVYREWYGVALKPDGSFEPNVGLKMTAEEVAEGVRFKEIGDRITFGVADPSIFQRDGGPSIGERMAQRKVAWRPADRKRKTGWDQVRRRLEGEAGVPQLYFLDCCEHLIRTLPALQHDDHDAEDLDTDAEDHAADTLRYLCMSRPRPAKGDGLGTDTPRPNNLIELPLRELIRRNWQRKHADQSSMRID